MRISIDAKNKKTDIDGDVERLAEKIIENNEKDWKMKFDTKHNAKKEMLEIKHRHKMETVDMNQRKKSWIQIMREEKIKNKELEMEEKRRQAEEQHQKIKIKAIISCVLGIIGLTMLATGIILGTLSGDGDSGWYGLSAIGFLPLISISFIWEHNSNNKKGKKK